MDLLSVIHKLSNLLDWIYKKKCYFCHSSQDCVKMCHKCYDSLEFLSYDKFIEINGVAIYCAGFYEEKLQKLIRGVKYHNQKDLAYYQAKFMWEYWQNISSNDKYTVIPVPLHKNRLKKRKYNHMELVGEEFCKLSGYDYCSNLIYRIKDTKPQYRLNSAQRALNLAGAFEVNSALKIEGKLLIIDDITTTGATFSEMIKTLKNAGYTDITCLATTTPRIQMILAEFAKYIIGNKDKIIKGEKSATYILTDWIRNTLNTEPVQHWQRIIHTEIYLAQNSYNEFLILGKSDSGRILINALYNYALSYEHYILAKNIPDSIEFRSENQSPISEHFAQCDGEISFVDGIPETQISLLQQLHLG